MTIDERLEKMVERHEALAQSVELLAGMQKNTEQQAQALLASMQSLSGAMTKLVAVVESHERRIQGLEG